MYRNAVNFGSQWEQMQRDTATAVTQSIWQTTVHTQSVFDQMNRLQALINECVTLS
jgi:hypothetical protein